MNRSLLRSVVSGFTCHAKVSLSLVGAALLAGAFLSPAAALAGNAGWYVEADAGQSRFSGLSANWSTRYPFPNFGGSFGATHAGYRLAVGASFNSYFGLELGYVHLGEVTGARTVISPGFCGTITPFCVAPTSYTVNASVLSRGWTLEAVGTFPFNESWAIFGRAGGIQAYSRLEDDVTPIPPYNSAGYIGANERTANDLDVTYGLGVQWSFAADWAARLSWDRYASLGSDLPTRSFNVNLTSLGIVYQF